MSIYLSISFAYLGYMQLHMDLLHILGNMCKFLYDS